MRRWVVLGIAALMLIAALVGLVLRDRPAVRPVAVTTQVSGPEESANASSVLEIAAEDDAAPWSQRDGSGYANDLVRAAFLAAGVPIHMQVVPYARCKQMVVEGQAAACFSMSRLPEMDVTTMFSAEPLFVCYADLMQREGDQRRLASEADLERGTVVGVVIGYEYPESIYRLEAAGTIVLEGSVSEDLNLKKLADGRIDAAIVNANEIKTIEYMAAKAGVSGKVKYAYRIGRLPAYLGFSRQHPLGAQTRERFDAGFRQILTDGTHARIAQAWAERARREAVALGALGDAGP